MFMFYFWSSCSVGITCVAVASGLGDKAVAIFASGFAVGTALWAIESLVKYQFAMLKSALMKAIDTTTSARGETKK